MLEGREGAGGTLGFKLTGKASSLLPCSSSPAHWAPPQVGKLRAVFAPGGGIADPTGSSSAGRETRNSGQLFAPTWEFSPRRSGEMPILTSTFRGRI